MKRTLLLVIVGLVVFAIVAAVTLVYVLTPPPVRLTVADGTSVGIIEGNLTSINSGNPLVFDFNATTYANQTGYPSSTLAIQVHGYADYIAAAGGYLFVSVDVAIVGHFASNLHPSGLQLTANATGRSADSLYFLPGLQRGTNVNWDANQSFGVYGTGSGQATATPLAAQFSYGAGFVAFEYLSHEQFLGFRITATGPFTPSIGVGILLGIINM